MSAGILFAGLAGGLKAVDEDERQKAKESRALNTQMGLEQWRMNMQNTFKLKDQHTQALVAAGLDLNDPANWKIPLGELQSKAASRKGELTATTQLAQWKAMYPEVTGKDGGEPVAADFKRHVALLEGDNATAVEYQRFSDPRTWEIYTATELKQHEAKIAAELAALDSPEAAALYALKIKRGVEGDEQKIELMNEVLSKHGFYKGKTPAEIGAMSEEVLRSVLKLPSQYSRYGGRNGLLNTVKPITDGARKAWTEVYEQYYRDSVTTVVSDMLWDDSNWNSNASEATIRTHRKNLFEAYDMYRAASTGEDKYDGKPLTLPDAKKKLEERLEKARPYFSSLAVDPKTGESVVSVDYGKLLLEYHDKMEAETRDMIVATGSASQGFNPRLPSRKEFREESLAWIRSGGLNDDGSERELRGYSVRALVEQLRQNQQQPGQQQQQAGGQQQTAASTDARGNPHNPQATVVPYKPGEAPQSQDAVAAALASQGKSQQDVVNTRTVGKQNDSTKAADRDAMRQAPVGQAAQWIAGKIMKMSFPREDMRAQAEYKMMMEFINAGAPYSIEELEAEVNRVKQGGNR